MFPKHASMSKIKTVLRGPRTRQLGSGAPQAVSLEENRDLMEFKIKEQGSETFSNLSRVTDMGPKPKSILPVHYRSCRCQRFLCLRSFLACDCSFFIVSCSCFRDAMLSQISLQIPITVPFPKLFVFLPESVILCRSWSLSLMLLTFFICVEKLGLFIQNLKWGSEWIFLCSWYDFLLLCM